MLQVLLPVKPSDFHIWDITPELGTFCDGHPQTVAGSMDPTFEGVAITNATINGQAALGWRYDDGSTAYYNLSATVPCPGTSEMTLKITVYLADGRQITMPFWYLEGYRIASKIEHYQNTAPHNNTCSSAPNYYANFYWEENFTPQPLDGKWQVTAFVMLDATNHYVAMTNSVTATNWAAYSQEYLTTTNLVDDPPSVEEITTNHWAARAPWSCGLGNMIPTGSHDSRYLWPWEVDPSLRFGTNNYYSEVTYNYPFGGCNPVKTQKMHAQIWVADAGEMVVNWPLHYPTNQQVLLTFEHMEYSRLNGEAYDPTQILYHGQPPDVIETNWDGNYNLGYIVSISGSSFTLNQDAFSWPTSTINISGTGTDPGGCWTSSGGTYGSAHHLGFSSFHNQTILPKIIVTQNLKKRVIYRKSPQMLHFEVVGVPTGLDHDLEWDLNEDDSYGTAPCEYNQKTATIDMTYVDNSTYCAIPENIDNRRKDIRVKVRRKGQSELLASTTIRVALNSGKLPVFANDPSQAALNTLGWHGEYSHLDDDQLNFVKDKLHTSLDVRTHRLVYLSNYPDPAATIWIAKGVITSGSPALVACTVVGTESWDYAQAELTDIVMKHEARHFYDYTSLAAYLNNAIDDGSVIVAIWRDLDLANENDKDIALHDQYVETEAYFSQLCDDTLSYNYLLTGQIFSRFIAYFKQSILLLNRTWKTGASGRELLRARLNQIRQQAVDKYPEMDNRGCDFYIPQTN